MLGLKLYPTPRNALSVGPSVTFFTPSNANAHQSNMRVCALDFLDLDVRKTWTSERPGRPGTWTSRDLDVRKTWKSERPGCPGTWTSRDLDVRKTWLSEDLDVQGPVCPGPECPKAVCPGPGCP